MESAQNLAEHHMKGKINQSVATLMDLRDRKPEIDSQRREENPDKRSFDNKDRCDTLSARKNCIQNFHQNSEDQRNTYGQQTINSTLILCTWIT